MGNFFRSCKASIQLCLGSIVIRYDSHIDLQKFYYTVNEVEGEDKIEVEEEIMENIEEPERNIKNRCFCFNGVELSDFESEEGD